jgi:hypothetical protein
MVSNMVVYLSIDLPMPISNHLSTALHGGMDGLPLEVSPQRPQQLLSQSLEHEQDLLMK